MPLTLDEVKRRAMEEDPLADSADEVTYDANGDLHIPGYDDTERGYRDTLSMSQDGDCVALKWRGPNDTDWQGPVLFDNFNELHGWVYTL